MYKRDCVAKSSPEGRNYIMARNYLDEVALDAVDGRDSSRVGNGNGVWCSAYNRSVS